MSSYVFQLMVSVHHPGNARKLRRLVKNWQWVIHPPVDLTRVLGFAGFPGAGFCFARFFVIAFLIIFSSPGQVIPDRFFQGAGAVPKFFFGLGPVEARVFDHGDQ